MQIYFHTLLIFTKGANIIGGHCTYLFLFIFSVNFLIHNGLLGQLNGCTLFCTMFHHFKTWICCLLCIHIQEIIS